MKKIVTIGLLLLLVFFFGCRVQYTEALVSGTIGGNIFSFVDGAIDASGIVEMYDEAKDFSNENSFTITYPHLLFKLPETAVGHYDLNFRLSNETTIFTATGLSVAQDNILFAKGYIEITAVTASSVSGGMYIEAGDDVLDGTFELERVAW